MHKIFRPPETAFSFEKFISAEALQEEGVVLVESLEEATAVCTALYREAEPLIREHGGRFKYLIWCNEPVWMLPELTDYQTLPSLAADEHSVDLAVLTYQFDKMKDAATLFLAPWYHSDAFLTRDFVALEERFPKAVYLAGFRDRASLEGGGQGRMRSLNRYRSEVALDLFRFGYADIWGQGWPEGVSRGESRSGAWVEAKLELVKDYRYCLALENTMAPNYVTEKIWQPISVGVLPIYLSGEYSTIYEMFPEGSFVDLADFGDAESLAKFLASMSDDEYRQRLARCLAVLEERTLRTGGYPEVVRRMAGTLRTALDSL